MLCASLILILFFFETILPLPIQPFFHGLPVMCAISLRSSLKYPLIFTISTIQVFLFNDHHCSIPFDLMALWIGELSVKVRMINSNTIYRLSFLFMALILSHLLQFFEFDLRLTLSSFLLWYLICTALSFRRKYS